MILYGELTFKIMYFTVVSLNEISIVSLELIAVFYCVAYIRDIQRSIVNFIF